MIKIIGLSVAIAFSLSLIFIIIFDEYFGATRVSEIEDDDFFSKEFEKNSKKIFTIGGSGMGQLNSTFIHNQLRESNLNVIYYNLAYNADTPKQRINSIDSTISLNPELIIYGITYYDFNGFEFLISSKNEQPLPDVKTNLENLLSIEKNPISQFNPKKNTLNYIRILLNDNDISGSSDEKFQLEHSPFTFFSNYQTIITPSDELENVSFESVSEKVNQNVKSFSEQTDNFEKIIQQFKKKNIDIVIVILPQQKSFNELIPESDKQIFYSKLQKLEKKYDFTIYDLSKKYHNLEIWQDHNHVALNKNSIIFSEDIYQIILEKFK